MIGSNYCLPTMSNCNKIVKLKQMIMCGLTLLTFYLLEKLKNLTIKDLNNPNFDLKDQNFDFFSP